MQTNMIKLPLSRRAALKMGTVSFLTVMLGSCQRHQHSTSTQAIRKDSTMDQLMGYENGTYVLPKLPYAYDALEPYYNEQTLRIHHDKHHAGYVRGLNTVLSKLKQARQDNDFALIKALSNDLAFNGSGHVLHTLFWHSMAPGGYQGTMSTDLKSLLSNSFGSVEAAQAQFAAATKAVEASGWGILAYEPLSQKLVILQSEKHQNLTIWGVIPIMVCDVWEHAYYLQYQNNRGQWVDNFMKLANWDFAAECLAQIKGTMAEMHI